MQIQHLVFVLGLILQAFLLVGKTESKRFFSLLKFVFLFALFLFINAAIRVDYYTPEDFITVVIFTFTILFFAVYIRDFLIKINELILLSFTLIFWYVFLLKFQFNLFLTIFALVPTIGVIYSSFTKNQLSNRRKLVFYLWFLIIDIFLIASYFIRGSLYSFIFGQEVGKISLIDSFFTGASFLYLSCNIWCFFLLFPMSRGARSFRMDPVKLTIQEVVRNARPVIDKYSNEQVKPLHSLILIIFQGGFLVLNYLYKFIPDTLVVSLFITIIPQLKGGDFRESTSTVPLNRF